MKLSSSLKTLLTPRPSPHEGFSLRPEAAAETLDRRLGGRTINRYWIDRSINIIAKIGVSRSRAFDNPGWRHTAPDTRGWLRLTCHQFSIHYWIGRVCGFEELDGKVSNYQVKRTQLVKNRMEWHDRDIYVEGFGIWIPSMVWPTSISSWDFQRLSNGVACEIEERIENRRRDKKKREQI